MTGTVERADMAAWLAVVAGTIGALMATLDISIINSSLPIIQGEIGASGSEGTWIGTAFLIAEIIAIILSGWFERLLGLRRLLMSVTILFIAFSMVCGFADNLTVMILGRIGQGITGGVLIPTAVTIVSKRLPPSQQPAGMALFGVTAMLGPVVGPVVGGYLAEHYSWRYSFFINLPIGLPLLALVRIGLPSSVARLELLRSADWAGMAGLILGLGSLIVVLEEGQRELWFESERIILLSIVALFGFALVVFGQMKARAPIVAFRLLRDRSFAIPVFLNTMLGVSFFCTIYLIPQFLAMIPGYNAAEIGMVVLLGGVPFIAMLPLFPILVKIIDIRVAVTIAILFQGTSMILEAGLTPGSGGQDFVLPQMLMGAGAFFGYAFLNQAAMTSVDRGIAEDASAIFNCARNLGGSLGLAIIATMFDRRLALHGDRIAESVSHNSARGQEILGWGQAGTRPIAILLHEIQRQASVMAFSDLFLLLGFLIFSMLPFVFLLTPIRDAETASLH